MVKPLVQIKDLVNYNKNVGTLSAHVFGLMGSGKSNYAFGLVLRTLVNRGEFCITAGDRMCEWRHFYHHPKYRKSGLGITVIIPPKDKVDIFTYNFIYEDHPAIDFIEEDYDELNILKYLNPKRPLVVVYDQHLRMASRAGLWAMILEQLVNRTIHVETAINLLLHEAGVLFSESSRGKHWQQIKDFSEVFVETRKSYIRAFLLSQLETELEFSIRRKCSFKVIKQSFLRTEYAKPARSQAPFLKINECILSRGGLYDLDATSPKTIEAPYLWKMIPSSSKFNLKFVEKSKAGRSIDPSSEDTDDAENRLKCPKCEHEWTKRKRAPMWCPRCHTKLVIGDEDD